MVFLADDALVLLLLGHLVSRLDHGRAAVLLRAGMDPAHVDQLRGLRLPDLRALAESPEPIVSLAIDTEVLARNLQMLSERDNLLRLRDEFIRLGASPALMRTLFSLPQKTTLQRRLEFNVPRRPGRPSLPTRAVRDAIQARWRDLTEPDRRKRFLALREVFPQFSLDALHVIVSEYETMGLEHTNGCMQRERKPPVRGAHRKAQSSR